MDSVVATQYARKMTLNQIARLLEEGPAGRESAATRDAIAREMLAQQSRGERMDLATAWAVIA